MKETEKIFMLFDQFLKEKGLKQEDLSEKEFFDLFGEFKDLYNSKMYQMKDLGNIEESDDLYEQALNAEDYDEKIKLLKQALKVNPKNFDAKVELTFETNPDFGICIELVQLLYEERERLEKEEGITQEDEGDFYGILETRPFMRAKYRLARMYNTCGMHRLAIDECEEILRLNEHDNFGVRYLLMSLYARLCMLDEAIDLYDACEEESIPMLMYMCVCAYRCGEWMMAADYLEKVVEILPEFYTLFMADDEEFNKFMEATELFADHYEENSVHELFMAMELQPDLFENESFSEWTGYELIRMQKEEEEQIKH